MASKLAYGRGLSETTKQWLTFAVFSAIFCALFWLVGLALLTAWVHWVLLPTTGGIG